MAGPYPRSRVTAKRECRGWHVSLILGPDAGPQEICHHGTWQAAMRCANANMVMVAVLPTILFPEARS